MIQVTFLPSKNVLNNSIRFKDKEENRNYIEISI